MKPKKFLSFKIYVDGLNGNDLNSGTIGSQLKTLTKAASLTQCNWTGNAEIICSNTINENGSGTPTQTNIVFGRPCGPNSTPLVIRAATASDMTSELGTRTSTAAASTGLTDNTITVRSSATASVIAGAPAGQVRISVGGYTGADIDVTKVSVTNAATGGNNLDSGTIRDCNPGVSIDVVNAQGVVGDTNITVTDSYVGLWISTLSSLANCVAKAGLVNNDNFTVTPKTGAAVTYEFKVTGGFGAVGGRVTVDVTAAVSATDVAVAAKTAINTHTGTTNVTASNLAGVLFCSTGVAGQNNTTLTENVANPGFTVSNTSGQRRQIRSHTVAGAFVVKDTFSPAPVAGSIFVVEKCAATINFNASTVIDAGGHLLGWKGIKRNWLVASSQLDGNWIQEGVEDDAHGTTFTIRNLGQQTGGPDGSGFWNALGVLNPFDTTLRLPGGVFFHDGTMLLVNSGRMIQHFMYRAALLSASRAATAVLVDPDFARSNIAAALGARVDVVVNAGQSAKFNGQTTTSATGAIISYATGAGGQIQSGTDVSNSGGHGILENQGAGPVTYGIVTGTGNAGVGLRLRDRSFGVAPASAITITGAGGDFQVGNRSPRTWTAGSASFFGAAPVGLEADITSDGSALQIANCTATMPLIAQDVATGLGTTVGAAAVVLATLSPPAGALQDVKVRMIGRRTNADQFVIVNLTSTYTRLALGAPTLQIADTSVVLPGSSGALAGAVASTTVLGNTIQLKVTGVAGATIDWKLGAGGVPAVA